MPQISSKELVDIKATSECRFSLKHVCEMIKTGFQHADFSASADFLACADFSAYSQRGLLNKNIFILQRSR